jgi:apolipoprotein N-acyltransferase
MVQRFFSNKYSIFPVILISSLLYFLSTGLQVNYWFLLWFAPVPILLYSFFNSNKAVFWVAFTAFTLSKANILLYFMRLLPLALAVMIIMITGLLFACAIALNKTMTTRLKAPVAVFVFPVLMTVLGFILNLIDGTFGDMASLAYTQVNNVYLLQIISITGMYGITFILALFSSLVTFLLLTNNQKFRYQTLFCLL